MKNDLISALSPVVQKELEELYQSDHNSTKIEIIEKAIDLLNAAEIIGDCWLPALDTEYLYRVKKDKYNPVRIDD